MKSRGRRKRKMPIILIGDTCSFCHQFTSTPREGWRLRNFTYTKLCGPCFFAYSDGSFCQKHHRHEDGWRQCDVCERRVHCGCIMSLHLFETNDTRGVTCKKCLDKMSPVVSIRGTSSSTLDESCSSKSVTGLYLLAAIGSAIEYSVADPTISAEPTTARVVSANPTIRDAPADPTIGDAPAVSEDDHNPATIIGDAPADLATGDAATDNSIIADATFADPATRDVPAKLAIIGDVVNPSIPATIRDALAVPANTKDTPDPVIIGDAPFAPTITRDAPRDAIIGDAPTTIIQYALALPDPTITEDALVDPTITGDGLANPTVIEDALAAPAIIRDAPADPVIIKDTLVSPTATGNVLADPSMDDASADPIVGDAIRDVSVDPSTIKDTFVSFAIIGDAPAHPAVSDASGNASSRDPSIIGDASADPSIIGYASAKPTIISDVDPVIVGDASIDPTNVRDADPVIIRNAITDFSTRDDSTFPVAEDVSVELVAGGVFGDLATGADPTIRDAFNSIEDGFASNPIDLATEYASVYPPIIGDAYFDPITEDAYYPTIEDTLADSFTVINYAFSSVDPTIGDNSDVTDSTIGAVFGPAATSAVATGDDPVASASDIGDGFDSSTFRCANPVIGNACADHSVSAVSAEGPEAPEPGTD
ncbi:uncharacterized protein LOC110693198 isoform X2 [Chenopodium quinoa]|uniref:uncharacterized protein LOC110693198 isoform X2 n=1 Tax=Chenopodium quinoa TaxID=63459 RepID=UPI000B776036|nr:uncharacterized protein LOC110693198 isoform X2 [Chenopodium quinoa]